jgi:hypothetical protein
MGAQARLYLPDIARFTVIFSDAESWSRIRIPRPFHESTDEIEGDLLCR